MPRERVRRQPRARTREDLLDAAARVFAERGFHGASVEAVADAAGYSTGALYSNFAGKEELFLSLYEERIERRRRELRDTAARSGPAAAAASVDESLRQDRDFFLLYFEFALHAARNRAFARRFRAVRDEGLAELTAGLADTLEHFGMQSGLAPEELARAVRALSYGMALDQLVGDTDAPENLVGRLLHLAFAGMRAEEAT
jgi:AcrR family transcriptional regulator